MIQRFIACGLAILRCLLTHGHLDILESEYSIRVSHHHQRIQSNAKMRIKCDQQPECTQRIEPSPAIATVIALYRPQTGLTIPRIAAT